MTKKEVKDYLIARCNPDYPEGETQWELVVNMAINALTAIESLESEYRAYHTDSDYWRGVRYALDVIGGEQE